MKTNKKGFTLIELMIVVAIIGILAAIAIPKFADLISKSKEGATKGELSTTRSALQIYYGDKEGWFPAGAAALDSLIPTYLKAIPQAKLPRTGHADSAGIVYSITGTVVAPSDAGAWHYDANPSSSSWGNFIVNCSHEDIKGMETAGAQAGWSTF